MPAYVIFIRERTLDRSELETYARMAPPSLEGWPIKLLAAYGHQDVLEGPEPEGVAIAEFREFNLKHRPRFSRQTSTRAVLVRPPSR